MRDATGDGIGRTRFFRSTGELIGLVRPHRHEPRVIPFDRGGRRPIDNVLVPGSGIGGGM
ncbi:hypothetical protein C357_04747 [Citreicella sp. 357]|nr:hypothetical protein C357_04747 [Citreicella sp. 357]